MEMGEEGGEGRSRRIQARFVTKLEAAFKVPTTAIAIPADLTRFGLSSLVNALLQAKGIILPTLYKYPFSLCFSFFDF